MLLSIETSCDETAVSLFALSEFLAGKQSTREALRAEVISSQSKLHEPYGGVVPELAAREHVVNLPLLVEGLLREAGVGVGELRAVAVTRGPGLKGCLLVGLSYAKGLAFSAGIPLLALNHLEGHIFAGELMGGFSEGDYPALVLLVSGGHTQLVFVRSFRDYEIVAKTRDDAAGEAFDKSATLLGLPYPGGPALSKRAEKGDRAKYEFPLGVSKDPASFSFSGLKTAVNRKVVELGEEGKVESVVSDLAASVEWAIVRALVEKSMQAVKARRPKSFVLTGGVAANGSLRATLEKELGKVGVKFIVPERKWCTDNASMMGALALNIIRSDPQGYLDFKPNGETLGPGVGFNVDALPRWPLTDLTGVK